MHRASSALESTNATPRFLGRSLGAPSHAPPRVRLPAAGVRVRLGRAGYSVTSARHRTVSVAHVGAHARWSQFANGVSRKTAFGAETITVLPARTEEFLTVSHHQGTRTWRWRVGTRLHPRRAGDGGITLAAGAASPLRIAPVRILDANGKDVAPDGLRWALRRRGAHSWWLELRLDDRRLPLPYVIDPAIDYPSPLYLSSSPSAASGSWRLLAASPSSPNSTTSTVPASGATGYFLFKPGQQNTAAGTPSASGADMGFVQDVAGGTGFPAGTWRFSVETQIPSGTLVSGSAILAIGVWAGTVARNGKFNERQTIMAPTDDPAAQNVRASLGVRTTTVTYSLPAFSLAATDRLYVEVWRKQVAGVTSTAAANRQVNLIVNDGVSRITHPPADDTLPVNAFQVVNPTGGVYFTNPGGPTGTVYVRGSAAGSFRLQDLATDAGSGVAQVTYPAVGVTGWTHGSETVTAAPSYQSSLYSWTAGAGSPGAQAIAAQDAALNRSTGSPLTLTNDSTGPSAPTVALTSPPAWYTAPVGLTLTDGTDSGSGLDPTSRIIQRDEASTIGGACNAFPNTWSTVVSNPDTTIQNGECYRYRLLESDRVGNQTASAPSGTAKIDLQPPTQPSLAYSALSNASASGSTVYYRPGVNGSFTVTASGSTDAESGLSAYVFPTPATWTVTDLGASRTFAWNGTPTPPGSLGVHARDVAGNNGQDAAFTPTPDSASPSTSDDTAAIGSGWKTTAQMVTLTATDGLSGVASTYYTTDGSTPTTSSASGTSISLAADGVYTIKYFSVDKVGNAEPVRTASTTIRVDSTASTVALGPLPSVIRNGRTLAASASDSGSGIASVAYYYCGPSPCAPATPLGSSAAGPDYAVDWTGQPPDGSYDVVAVATDNAGNTATSAKAKVAVDNTVPETTIAAQPPDPSTSTSAAFSFISSEGSSTFQCSLDGGAQSPCTSPQSFTGLTEGAHTFTVQATDGAGNTDPTPATYTWTIDASAPETTITSKPNDLSNDRSPVFSFASSKPGSTFQCQLDGAAFAACTSPNTLSGLTDGTHTFAVQATDDSGHVDPTPASYTWTLDTTEPDTTITSSPGNPSNDWAPSFTFTSTKPGSSFECQLDGVGFTPCTSPMSYNDVADGPHAFTVRAKDAAGNVDSTPATYSWTIDTSNVPLTADEVHYTYTGPTSVAFDWRGSPTDIRYGTTNTYGNTATAHAPDPLPFSSAGPFREVELTGLAPGTTYHYSIGGGRDHVFSTAPTGTFRFDVIADVGSSVVSARMPLVQNQVAADLPAFVLVPGDLTYGNAVGQISVDRHFNEVMAWSQIAAYMPSWGNHESETPAADDLRNYKGRFKLPNAQTIPSAPSLGCCGEDWGWFDAGGVRFISYPELWRTSTVSEWQNAVDPVIASAQADPSIHFIVTYGHEPAHSTGFHAPSADLAVALASFGDRYPKYVLNINGHNHDYERFQPIHGVTNITTGAATTLEPPWTTTDQRTAFRAMHVEHLRVDVGSDGMRIEAICGPATAQDDVTCPEGSVLDSYTIGTPAPPPPQAPVLYVDNGNPLCSDAGLGAPYEPFCTIGAAASRVNPGQTVEVGSGVYPESVTVPTSATEAAPIVFTPAPGASVVLSGGANGFSISNKSWIAIKGFTITSTSGVGISVQNSSNITISDNHVSQAGQPISGQTKSGIYFNTVRDSAITRNTTDHNSSFGIYLVGSTRNDVSENSTFNNAQGFQRAASGIRLYSSTQNTIAANVTHDNEDSGIESFTNSNDNLIVDNVSYKNGDHGIDNYASTGQRLVANTVYRNVTAGINVEGGSTGATIANNISVDNGIASPRTHSDIRVEVGSTSGTTMDYDLAFLTSADTLLIWNSIAYSSLASFQAATGQEQHGVQANPKWRNVSSFDFHLTPGSPAIDSADSGVSGEPDGDVEAASRVDDPITADTGVGPRTYDDRGAYELPAATLDHIAITPDAPTIAAGGTEAFTVRGFDSAGNLIGDVTASTRFSIAPAGSCTANACTATKAGPYTVTASDTGKTATASLAVTAAALDHLVLSPAAATVTAGATRTYTAEGRDAYENSLGDLTSSTAFTISPNGSCAGATCGASIAGTHTVTGTSSGKTGTASLQVTASALDHIVIAPSNATIVAGGSKTYTAQGFDSAGNSIGDVTPGTIFSIGPDGTCSGNVCTAIKAGTHTVTGNDGGRTSTASLTVNGGTLDHITLAPAEATIAAGDSRSYTATGRDAFDNSLGDVTSTTTFSLAPDGSCSGNVCTAVVAGAHTVTGTVSGASGTASLQVTAGSLDHLVLAPASASVTAGASQTYTARGVDANGNSLGDVTSTTTFAIAPDGSCSGATCVAPSVGTHTVTGRSGTATGTATLEAREPSQVDHIVVSPSSATIDAGESGEFTVEAFAASGESLGDVTSSSSFSIEPDGSCTGNVCTATPAWPHTVTAEYSGHTDEASLFVTPGALDHLEFTPVSSSITAGSSETFAVDGRDRYENSLGDVTAATELSIEPDGSCAGDVCTATVAGPHTVHGAYAGATGVASIDVLPAAVDHLVVAPASATIATGQTQDYTAQARDRYGNSLGDVSADAVFSITPDGSCSGATCGGSDAGEHTITATYLGANGTALLRVVVGALDHIVLSPSSATLTAGSSQTFTVEGFDAAGASLGDVTAGTTLSIAPDGSCSGASCTATAAGTHTVTANAGGKTDTAAVTVNPASLDHLVLAPASATIAARDSQTFTAEGRDQYNNQLGDLTALTTFTIMPNGSCIGASCTASSVGAHTVTGTSSGKSGSASLQVRASTLDHIVISPASATITAGGAQSYTAQGFDAADNSVGDVTAGTTFTIAPDGSCSGNVCTATVAGVHTITGSNGAMTSSASLTVNAGALDHLALSPATASIGSGGSQAYAAQGRDQYDNSLGDVTSTTTFTIAPDGSCAGATCTATTSGVHTVTGTRAGRSGTASLQVSAGSLDHIVISPAPAAISAGSSQTYTAQGFDAANNSLGDVTANTTFAIIPDGSCTANACTATTAGTHTVTGNDSGKTSSASLTVNPAALDHLALSPASGAIVAGGSQSYTAEGRDRYENSRGDVTSLTTFTIAPNGSCFAASCTATTSGAHTVTGMLSGATGSASLQVNPASLDHIVIGPASGTINAGSSQTYTAQGFDAFNNSRGDVTPATTFAISPEGSCSGAVCTANAGGRHTVTGTDAGKTSSAALNVDYVGNPGLETDLSGWNASGSGTGVTLTRVAGGHSGNWSAKLANTGSANTTCLLNDSPDWGKPTVVGIYTATLWVRGDAAGAPLKLRLREYNISSGALIGTSIAQVALSTTWQQVTVRYPVTSAGTTLDLNAYLATADAPPGTCFYADDASVLVGPPPDHIVLSPATATIAAGGSQAYTAEAFDAANNSLGDVTAAAAFTISPNGSCSGVTCTATAVGAHTVTGAFGGKTSTASLSVTAGALDHLVLAPATATISPGATQTYTAEGRDQYDNSLGDVTSTTTFTIGPNGSCTGATCTATSSGSHTVTGSKAGKTGTAALTVGAGGLDHIVISPATAPISAGGSQAYTAEAFDAGNNSLGDVTATTTFALAPEGSCSGAVCTANAGGRHTVTGTNAGKSATATLNVSFVKNFGFETDLSGWNTSGSATGVTVTRVSGGHSGSWAAKLTNTNTANGTCLLNDSPDWTKPTAAGNYTGTLWARADSAGAPLKLRFREYSTTGVLLGTSTSQLTLTTSWQQVTVTYAVTSPGSSLDLNAYLSTADAPPGACFYADDVSVVAG